MYYILYIMRDSWNGWLLGRMGFKVIKAENFDRRDTFILGEWNRLVDNEYPSLAEAESERDRLWATNNHPLRVIVCGLLYPPFIWLRYKAMKADGLSFWSNS